MWRRLHSPRLYFIATTNACEISMAQTKKKKRQMGFENKTEILTSMSSEVCEEVTLGVTCLKDHHPSTAWKTLYLCWSCIYMNSTLTFPDRVCDCSHDDITHMQLPSVPQHEIDHSCGTTYGWERNIQHWFDTQKDRESVHENDLGASRYSDLLLIHR